MPRRAATLTATVIAAGLALLGAMPAQALTPTGYVLDVTIPLASSTDAALAPDGTIYAASSSGLTVFSGGGPYTSQTLGFIAEPLSVAVSPDGTALAVSDADTGEVTVVALSGSTAGMAVPLSVATRAQGVEFTHDGDLLIADYGASRVLRLHPAGAGGMWSVTADIPVAASPRWVTETADGTILVTHQSTTANVSVLRNGGSGYTTVDIVSLIGAPYGITASDDGSVLVVTSAGMPTSASLFRLEVTNGSWSQTGRYDLARSAYGVAAMPGGRALVTGLTAGLQIWSKQLTITTSDLGALTVGTSGSTTLAVDGGSGSVSWAVTAGALPAGLVLSPSGVVSGSPTQEGDYSVTLTATDDLTGANTASRVFSGTVAPATVPVSGGVSDVPPATGNGNATTSVVTKLPNTGAPVLPLGLAALAFGSAGLLLLALGRRRHVAWPGVSLSSG